MTLNIGDLDRSKPLTADEKKKLKKLLPAGASIAEGDFADDEKWRIVDAEPATAEADDVPDTPTVGECACGCGTEIREHEPRISEGRGKRVKHWIEEHYASK